MNTGRPLKIKVVSYSSSGGAGGSAATLLKGFLELGHEATFATLSESNLRASPLEHPPTTAAAAFDNFLVRKSNWSSLISLYRDRVSRSIEVEHDVDLLILRWMNGVSLRIDSPSNLRVLWVLDDMNSFTGTCHYSVDCLGFTSGCSNCPAVREPFRSEVERNFDRKRLFVSGLGRLGFVAPSTWIQDQFLKSQLGSRFPSRVISNAINPVFLDQTSSIARIESPQIETVIVAADLSDPIKGVDEVAPTLAKLLEENRIGLRLVGRYSMELRKALPGAEFLGELEPSGVARELARAAIQIVPSLADVSPSIVAEASSQGTPSVVRNVGGLPERVGFGDRGWVFGNTTELESILLAISNDNIRSKGKAAKLWSHDLQAHIVSKHYLDFAETL